MAAGPSAGACRFSSLAKPPWVKYKEIMVCKKYQPSVPDLLNATQREFILCNEIGDLLIGAKYFRHLVFTAGNRLLQSRI